MEKSLKWKLPNCGPELMVTMSLFSPFSFCLCLSLTLGIDNTNVTIC